MRLTATEAPTFVDVPGMAIRGADWGGLRCVHLALGPGGDTRPAMKGLQDDSCQVVHWGYVLAGSLTVVYTGGQQETLRAGDLFYLPPGHVGWTDEGVTLVEFSPEREMHALYDHLGVSNQPQG
jgi:hypothetical protein